MENEKNTADVQEHESQKTSKTKKKKLNGTQKILIAGFSLVIIGGAVLGYVLINKETPAETPSIQEQVDSGNFIIDENNFEQIQNSMEEKVADGMFECSMNTVWGFPSNKSTSTNAYVANSYTNHKPFYFDLKVNDQIIYTSTLLPVGTSLKELTIDSDLADGSYEAICTYHLMNELEDGKYEENSSVMFNITVIIGNNA